MRKDLEKNLTYFSCLFIEIAILLFMALVKIQNEVI